jgi:hypothetical protein
VNETVTDWLNGVAADFYDKGIVKLVHRLDKCLNRNGNYVENITFLLLVLISVEAE